MNTKITVVGEYDIEQNDPINEHYSKWSLLATCLDFENANKFCKFTDDFKKGDKYRITVEKIDDSIPDFPTQENLQDFVDSIIVFTNNVLNLDSNWEEGMKARIVSVQLEEDWGFSIKIDFSDFEQYNRQFMKDVYFPDDNSYNLVKWCETKYYPKVFTDRVFCGWGDPVFSRLN